MRLWHEHGVNIALALAAGLALRFGFGLQPLWWLAWLAPAPLLVAALRSTARTAWGLAFLVGLVAAGGQFHFLARTMPLAAAIWVTVLQALAWVLVVGLARRVMVRSASAWTVLAYPLLWCAVDTLLAGLHPDANWGSLAYSQAGFLPAVQVLALLGTAGLVFVLSLVPAAIALGVVRGWRAVRVPGLCALALVAATFGFGYARMPAAAPAQGTPVGLAVIDDFIGPRVPPAQVERIWAQYERHVETLAAQGARIVVLPEKIAVLNPLQAARIERRMSALAARTQAWLALGIGIDDGREKRNLAWLFAPTAGATPAIRSTTWRRPSANSRPDRATTCATSAAPATAWRSARTCTSPPWAAPTARARPAPCWCRPGTSVLTPGMRRGCRRCVAWRAVLRWCVRRARAC